MLGNKLWVFRAWVLAASQAIASPFAAGVLLLPPPYCFASLLIAYLFAEMWFGVLFAILIELVPAAACSFVIAVFLFVMNNVKLILYFSIRKHITHNSNRLEATYQSSSLQ
jgi:hypothetical protein